MACTGCGKDEILVYSGLLNGNLCQSCYYKYGINNRDARQKELEKQFYAKCDELGICSILNKELIRLHRNFVVCPEKKITVHDNRVQLDFTMRYMGKTADVEIHGNRNNKENKCIVETIKYIIKGGSVSIVENTYYKDGKTVQRRGKIERKDKKITAIEFITADNEVYTIDAKTGNFIKGYVNVGNGCFDYRNYGDSPNWRVFGLWTLRGGHMTRVNITPYQLAGACNKKTQKEINDILLYKNGKPKYGIVDVDHGTERVWVGLEKRGIKHIRITQLEILKLVTTYQN